MGELPAARKGFSAIYFDWIILVRTLNHIAIAFTNYCNLFGSMAPQLKRRKLENAVEEISFDPDARHEFLTGFHKRKVQRIKLAQEHAEKRAREEKREERRKVQRLQLHSASGISLTFICTADSRTTSSRNRTSPQ